MAKSFSELLVQLPVDLWLSNLHDIQFNLRDDAEIFESNLFYCLKDRHEQNIRQFLPIEHKKIAIEFASGFEIYSNDKGIFQIDIQFSPENIDQLVNYVPTGHPSDPTSYYILAKCIDNPDITYLDLRIKRSND